MSREAPIPVLEFESRRLIPGGAANPAANVVSLGSDALQVGVIGSDSQGEQLRVALRERGIKTDGLIVDPTRPTTVKTRIMAQMGLRFPQQVARIDTLSRQPIGSQIEAQIRDFVRPSIAYVDALLFSDYQTGFITPALIKLIQKVAADLGKAPIMTADAQGAFDKYHGFTLVKCNADEAAAYLRRPLVTHEDFAHAAIELCGTLQLKGAMVITRGAEGATLGLPDGTFQHCPAPEVTDVYDTVGAGDTAIAVLTLAAAAGIPYSVGAMLANYASGIVVRRVGNYAPTLDELSAAIREGF
jgi:rfaE bifunctional protein kinase chain/domain